MECIKRQRLKSFSFYIFFTVATFYVILDVSRTFYMIRSENRASHKLFHRGNTNYGRFIPNFPSNVSCDGWWWTEHVIETTENASAPELATNAKLVFDIKSLVGS